MREFSVEFYKKLIYSTALAILIIIALVITYIIGSFAGVWGKDEGPKTGNGPGQEVSQDSETPGLAAPEEQQGLQPDSTQEGQLPAGAKKDGKRLYITFEDGGSANTDAILDLLKEEGVRAAFFFNTSEKQTSDRILKRTFDEGHTVGVLTGKDSLRELYESLDTYRADFQDSVRRIAEVTGTAPKIVRFPGGSINGYDRNNYSQLTDFVLSQGMTYYDWNVVADDGSARMSLDQMVANGTRLPARKDCCILLVHDNGNPNTCAALKKIISWYKAQGYEIDKLTSDVDPIRF